MTRLFLLLIERYFRLWIRSRPVLDKHEIFPDGATFEAVWTQIRDEVEVYLRQKWQEVPEFSEVDARQYDIANTDPHKWKTVMLKMYGVYINETISPTLAKLVRAHDEVISSAIISCMEAGKEVPVHRGPNKGIMRYHLPLIVGSGECFLVINGQRVDLKEGEGLLWDDSFPHSASNQTDTTRVALLLDVKRQMPRHLDVLYEFLLKGMRRSGEFKAAIERARIQ
jgi:aspartyl/asparaginyl beta-hydroxylase (cupin superfamily)